MDGDSGGLYFRVLGPLSVERDGHPVTIGGPQHRAVLALLLLNVGRVVPADELIDALWEDRPPVTCRTRIQGLVSGLRHALGTGGRRDAAPIDTIAPGYRLTVPPDRFDLAEFRRDLENARGRAAAGDPASAAGLLGTALSRWRGAAFADVSCPAVTAGAAGLEELRLSAIEDRIDAEIALGRRQDLIAELSTLVADHPLRELFRAQYMTVLVREGRAADALAVFRDLRERLVEELGIEPSDRLQRLHSDILRGDVPVGVRTAVPVRASVVPRQLPGDEGILVGRDERLREAMDLLRSDDMPTAPCVVVTGAGGIGKTAFALRVAHRVPAEFPDGQLYARLGGSGRNRLEPGTVLSRFLLALGIPAAEMPDSVDERSGLFRSLLADRRMLIALDDVADEAQLQPLLPAAPRCAVIATSRRRLSAPGILRLLPLDVLDEEDGLTLLREVAGPARAGAEPAGLAEIVRLCGGLPLAIRIAGARLATRPNWSPAHMARRLADGRARLDWLELGDTGVRATLADSYSELSADRQRLFRLLGLLSTADFPSWVPAALLDEPVGAAERLLDGLVDVHLVEPAGTVVTGPRYRMHDLVHLFASELADPADRDGAVRRVLSGWFDLAVAADTELPHWYGLDPEPPPGWRAPAEARDAVRDAPVSWFEEESSVLAGVVRQAGASGHPDIAWPLAQRMSTFLESRGHYGLWREVLRDGLHAAEQAEDPRGIACMLGLLIDAEAVRDDIDAAMSYAERAVAAYGALPREPDTVRTGAPPRHRKPPAEPARYARALTDARRAGDPLAVGAAVYALILERRSAGVHGGYLPLFEEGRRALRACGAHLSELWMVKNAGLAHFKGGRFEEAIECLIRGQEIVRLLGDDARLSEGPRAGMRLHTTGDIVDVYLSQGRFDEAERIVRENLELSRVHSGLWEEGRALDTMGHVLRVRGDHDGALGVLSDALAVWRRLGATARAARTAHELAELRREIGDLGDAGLDRPEYAALRERSDGSAG